MSATYALAVIEEHGARPGLAGFIETLHGRICEMAEALGVPDVDLTVVLTGDITASVRARSETERDFTPERAGGTVRGKTISLVRDFSETAIVLDTGGTEPGRDSDAVDFLHLLGHEYGHVLLGRLRASAGTRPPRTDRAKSPDEAAAIWAYEAADEFRCDLFSNLLLGAFAAATSDSCEPRPITLADLFGSGYRKAFVDLLDDVHPGWPDLVHAHRERRIEPDALYTGLILATGSVLKLIAHADAVEEAGGNGPLLTASMDHPAVHQLLGPPWARIREVLDTTSLLPPLAEFAATDLAIQDCGQYIVDMWEALGVTGHLTVDDEVCIFVC
ncbi:hypothetical protein [Kitasatospora purpeofusca]|uniref:hypothetical protein n=1 Tax=Kitasatospora purpeofusca TaxID=67352 RepID=UPI00369875A0